jgi:hypothetical protein
LGLSFLHEQGLRMTCNAISFRDENPGKHRSACAKR